MRTPLRGARTSARLADKLLASLAQFTHSMLLAQNHTCRQVPSAHRPLIQHFLETPLISLLHNHMHTERLTLLANSALMALLINTLAEPPFVRSWPWWQGSYDLSRPSTKVSAKTDHKQLRYRTLCPLGAPPGGTI